MLDALCPVTLLIIWSFILLYGSGTSLALWLSPGAGRWLASGMKEVGRVHGFRMRKSGRRAASGARGDELLQVDLIFVPAREADTAHNELVVSLSSPWLPPSIAFSAEKGTGDVVTGDTAFDDAVEALGNPTMLAALLGTDVRDRVRRLVGWDGVLRGQTITWRMRTAFSANDILWSTTQVVELAERLTSPEGGGICERLARNARKDAEAGVRLWNLTLLQQTFPERPETQAASAAALADRDPWVRLAAARFLPIEGASVLKELLADPSSPDQAAAESAALLGARLGVEEAGPLLLTALKVRSGSARRQVVSELGRLRYTPAFGALCVLLGRSEPRLAAAAAGALASLADVRAERHLLDALRREASELTTAIARALGAIGTVAAVQPLLELQTQARTSAETRQALREAVAAVQSRLAGAEAGQLTLASMSAEAGRLSLTAPMAGRGDVSIVDSEA